MIRPEERDPAVIALAQGFTRQRRELNLTTLEALVGIKLVVEVLLTEAGVVSAPMHVLRQMLDEVERERRTDEFPQRIEPYPVERWKLPKTPA